MIDEHCSHELHENFFMFTDNPTNNKYRTSVGTIARTLEQYNYINKKMRIYVRLTQTMDRTEKTTKCS